MADITYCVVCGKPKIKRAKALYCSIACQQKAKREREKQSMLQMQAEFEETKELGGKLEQKVMEVQKENENLQVRLVSMSDMFALVLKIEVLDTIASDYLKEKLGFNKESNDFARSFTKEEYIEYKKLRDASKPLHALFKSLYIEECKKIYGEEIWPNYVNDAYSLVGANTPEEVRAYLNEEIRKIKER